MLRGGSPTTPVRRRALVLGAAWTVPAVAVAAPAMAASGCYSVRAAGSVTFPDGFDRIRLTALEQIPAGATVTWTVKNLSGASRTYQIRNSLGVTLSSGNATVTVADNGTVTFSFRVNTTVAAGSQIGWELAAGLYNSYYRYNSSIRVGVSGCPPVCLSDDGSGGFGNSCPTAGTAVAAAAPAGASAQSVEQPRGGTA